jgi:hypothetical protein
MKLITIGNLFEVIKKVSKEKRKNNLLFDGRKFWQPIKKILATTEWKEIKWKKQSIKRYKLIMSLPEFYIDGYGNQNIIEENHFLIQTVRIPQNEKPSLRKICQVALNIGQYQGITKKKIDNNNINYFLYKKDISILLQDIIHKNKIKELEKILKK